MLCDLVGTSGGGYEALEYCREIKPPIESILNLSKIAVNIFFKVKRMVSAGDGIF